MRALKPVLNTGTRSVELRLNVNSGESPFSHATPASKNGAISVGKYGKLINPNSRTPSNGKRISKFATPILLLGGVGDPAEADDAVALHLTVAMHHPGQLRWLVRAAAERQVRIPVHVEVDTGMGRSGVSEAEAVELLTQVAGEPGLHLEGVFTHFARADEPDPGPTVDQLERFARVLEEAARAVLAKAGRTEADIDWLIPHQANIRIMQGTAKKLQLPLEKLVVTVDQHGNTSAASIPLALDHAVRTGRVRGGDTVMLEGVGGGFTWGAVLLEF